MEWVSHPKTSCDVTKQLVSDKFDSFGKEERDLFLLEALFMFNGLVQLCLDIPICFAHMRMTSLGLPHSPLGSSCFLSKSTNTLKTCVTFAQADSGLINCVSELF